MVSSEIKETIYLAITCILLASVLGIVAFVMDIRSDFAGVRNDEFATKSNMEAYTEFNCYQGQVLYGEDIIAVIREYAGTDIVVYVDNLKGETGSRPFYMNKASFVANPNIASYKELEYGKGAGQIQGGVNRDATYFSYLVFGQYTNNLTDFREQYLKSKDSFSFADGGGNLSYSEVTMIVIRKVGDTRNTYDECKAEIERIKDGSKSLF